MSPCRTGVNTPLSAPVQIRHAAKINEIESVEEIRKAEAHLKQHFNTRKK